MKMFEDAMTRKNPQEQSCWGQSKLRYWYVRGAAKKNGGRFAPHPFTKMRERMGDPTPACAYLPMTEPSKDRIVTPHTAKPVDTQ